MHSGLRSAPCCPAVSAVAEVLCWFCEKSSIHCRWQLVLRGWVVGGGGAVGHTPQLQLYRVAYLRPGRVEAFNAKSQYTIFSQPTELTQLWRIVGTAKLVELLLPYAVPSRENSAWIGAMGRSAPFAGSQPFGQKPKPAQQ